MKRFSSVILLCMVGISLFARNRAGDGIYLGWSALGGYDFQIKNQGMSRNGGMGALNMAIEYRHQNLALQTGVGAFYKNAKQTYDDRYATINPMIDSENDPCMIRLQYSNCNMTQTQIGVHVPVLIGGVWKRVYVLAGVTLGATLYNQEAYSANYSVIAKYPFFDSELADMPQHYLLTNMDAQTSKKPAIYVSGTVQAEVGWRIAPQESRNAKPEWRIGVFAAYRHPTKGNELDASYFDNWKDQSTESIPKQTQQLNDALTACIMDSKAMMNMEVGVKITMLIQPKPTSYCRCLDVK